MSGFFQVVINKSENEKITKTNNLSTYLLKYQEIQHVFPKISFLY